MNPPLELHLADRTVDLRRRLVQVGQEELGLSEVEARLLQRLAQEPHQIVTRGDLLVDVWGYRPTTQTRTLDTAVRRLRKKIEPDPNAPRYIVTAYGEGYRFVPHEPVTSEGLPQERGAFFAREAEVRALVEALAGGARLVTVVGPAGVGKTRFALRALRDIAPRVAFCELDASRSVADAIVAVAELIDPLGVGDTWERSLSGLARWPPGGVLALDNLEQLPESLNDVLRAWLEATPGLRIVATSRRPLGLEGEHVLPLEPLAVEGEGGAVGPAVAMFLDRVAVARGEGSSELELEELLPLVRLLDGLPLAIELAAARAHQMSIVDMRCLLELRRLSGGQAAGGARLSGLGRALDWSWELLSPPERLALAELSVFEGGFNLAAAEEVLALDALEATAWVPDVIDGLASHSLLQPGHELGRWRLLRTVQAYAAAKLVDPAAVPGFTGPEAARQTQARHAERYLRPLLDAHAYYMERLPADPERDRLRAELDNIQAALSYARGTLPPEGVVEVLRGASVLLWAWGLHSEVLRLSAGVEDGPLIVLRANALWELGRADASLRQLSERLAIEEDPTARGLLLMTQGTLLREQGHPRQALAACEQATDLLDAAGLRKRAMQSLSVRGLLLADLAEVEEALRTLRAAAKLAAGLNPSTEYVTVLTNLGVVEHGFGRLASAERRFRIALELATRPVERMLLQLDLAALLLDRGERTEAEALYRAIIEAAEPLGAPRLGALAEGNLGELLLCYGEPAAGLPHLRRATSRLRASASWRYLSWFLMRLGEVRIALGDLQGAALDVEESLEVLGEVQDVRIRAELAATQGLLAAALGDPGGGLTLSQQATAALQARQEPLPLARARVLEAEVLRLAGAHAAAGATLDRVRAAAREMGLAANAPVTRMERVVRQALRAGQRGLSPIWGGVGG